MLLELKQYLVYHRIANLEEMARHFQQDPAIIRNLLQHWIRKGKVVRRPSPTGCGTKCTQCDPKTAEVYEWIG